MKNLTNQQVLEQMEDIYRDFQMKLQLIRQKAEKIFDLHNKAEDSKKIEEVLTKIKKLHQ